MSEALPRIPTTDEWDWQMKGECRGQNSNTFFHPDNERGRARAARIARAKKICQSCEVLMQCRAYALETQEPYGIWGGMSETEREFQIRRMRRQAMGRRSLTETPFPGVEVRDNAT